MPSHKNNVFYRYESNNPKDDKRTIAEFADTHEPLSWEDRTNKTFQWIYEDLIKRSKAKKLDKIELQVLEKAKQYLGM